MPKVDKSSDMETEKTAVFSGDKTSFIKKFFNKFKKGSKRRALWIVGIVLLLMAIATAIWLVLWYIVPYSTVDGQQISRTQYDSMESKMEQFYKNNKDKNVQKSAEQAAKDRLIEEKIIESEAKKRGITASAEEINKRYQSIVSKYSSEAEYIKTIKNAYNWTPELTKQTIKIKILTEKLKKVVIKGYDVSYIFVRYDMISDKEDPNALPSIQKIYNRLKSGDSWDVVYTEYEKQEPIYTSFGKYENVNSVSEVFAGPENWQAISKLKKVGDITEITKANAGYYVIYHADRIAGGEFNTWEEFINYYKKNKVSSGGLLNEFLGAIDKFIWTKASAIGVCDATYCDRGGSDSTPYHPMIYAGDVRDANNGQLLGGVNVRLYTNANHDYTRQCNGVQIDAVFDKNVTTTGSDIWPDLNWNKPGDRRAINFHFGAREPACGGTYIKNGPDCHVKWYVKVTKPGYYSYSGEIGDTTPGGAYFNGEITFEDVALTPKTGGGGGGGGGGGESPQWSIIPGISVSTPTASPTQVVSWTHSIYNNGPDATSIVNYKWQNSGDWSGEGGASSFSGLVSHGTNNVPTSPSHTVTQDDVGKNLCRSTYAIPYSNAIASEIIAGPACAFIPYNYTLTPSVGLDHSGVIDAGTSLIATPSVTNAGPTKSEPAVWKLVRNVSGVDSTVIPQGSSVVFDPTGVATILTTYPDSDTNFPAGTRICYVAWVNPHASWDHSWVSSPANAACVVVGKRPKTQIWAGDLLVGGNVTAKKSTKAGSTYGSWAEYGILASGGITGAASGAAFAGPTGYIDATSSACDYNKLSFTNAGSSSCTDSTVIGGSYTNATGMPNVAASFPGGSTSVPDPSHVNPSSLDGTYNLSGDLTLDTPGPSTLTQGKTVVIKTNGTVIISANQLYDNGPYTDINRLPQLVIIAKDIVISSGVEKVNAWLIATNSIKTCEIQGKSTSQCATKLVVNGPVMTNHLYLYRTAGSEPADPGEPAETFNLRADAYLWAIAHASAKNYIQTVYNIELPPRL